MKEIFRPTGMNAEECAELLSALEKAGVTRGHLKQVSVNPGLALELARLLNGYLEGDLAYVYTLILPPHEQINAWKKCNEVGDFGISLSEFDVIPAPPHLSLQDREEGFVGVCLFYGFGEKGGHADIILSGRKAWEYIGKFIKVWKSDKADFDDATVLRIRKDAPKRPIGFYWKKVQLGYAQRDIPVESIGESLGNDWRMGPEGIQFLLIHPHYIKDLGNKEQIPNIVLAEFEARSTRGGFSRTLSLVLDRGRSQLSLMSERVDEKDMNYGFGTLRD